MLRRRSRSSASLLAAAAAVVVSAAAAAAVDVWAPTPTTIPLARGAHTVVADSLRHRLVLFGGLGVSAPLNNTAVFDLATHTWDDSVATTAPPGARAEHVAVWDAPRDRMLVFGGFTGVTRLNDLWSLNLSTMAWAPLAPTGTAPAARSEHVGVIDRAGDRLLVFGGTNGTTTFGDLFALNLATLAWSPLSPSGTPPEARAGALAGYDPVHRALVIVGGTGAVSGVLSDVWSLDLATLAWSQLAPSGAGPSPRTDASGALDPLRDQITLFGGRPTPTTYLADTWHFNLHTRRWSAVSPGTPPSARADAACASDPRDGGVIMTGGETAGGPLAETQAFDAALATWTLVPASGPAPSSRLDQCLASDDANDRVILFGGWLGSTKFTAMNDTWQLSYPTAASSGMVWTALNATNPPPARYGHSAIVDPPRNRLLVFGGSTVASLTNNDLWAMDLTTLAWTQLTPTGGPPPGRTNHAAVYDGAHGRMIVHGGQNGTSTALDDTWSYSLAGNAWTQVATAGNKPAARGGHFYASDDARNRMLVGFGSTGFFQPVLGDVWALDYASLTWSLVPTLNTPAGWTSTPAVIDTPRDRLLLFGGITTGGVYSGQTWALDLTTLTWTQLAPVGEVPGQRISHAMVYNPERAWAVTWGGNDGPTPLGTGGVLYTYAPAPVAVPEGEGVDTRGAAPLDVRWARDDVEVRFGDEAFRARVFAVDGRAVADLRPDADHVVRWTPRVARGVYVIVAERAGAVARGRVVVAR